MIVICRPRYPLPPGVSASLCSVGLALAPGLGQGIPGRIERLSLLNAARLAVGGMRCGCGFVIARAARQRVVRDLELESCVAEK
jgi:hypothetical protein